MKKLAILTSLCVALSLSIAHAQSGKKIFYEYGCTCHQATKSLLGPSRKDIRAAYAGNSKALQKYLKGKSKPIIDQSRSHMMQEPLQKIKGLTAKEYQLLADFILNGK